MTVRRVSQCPRIYGRKNTYVVDEAKASSTRKHEATPQIAPAKVADESREDETTEEDEGAVPAVLPPDDLILAQVADISDTRLAAGLDEHPADVGHQKPS